MASIADHLLAVSGLTVYLIVGELVFAEDALFVGFVLPGRPRRSSAAWPLTMCTRRSA